jgi:hypothetical protein
MKKKAGVSDDWIKNWQARETEEQLNFLLEQECDAAKGFLIGHPLTSEEFLQLLEEGKFGAFV